MVSGSGDQLSRCTGVGLSYTAASQSIFRKKSAFLSKQKHKKVPNANPFEQHYRKKVIKFSVSSVHTVILHNTHKGADRVSDLELSGNRQ